MVPSTSQCNPTCTITANQTPNTYIPSVRTADKRSTYYVEAETSKHSNHVPSSSPYQCTPSRHHAKRSRFSAINASTPWSLQKVIPAGTRPPSGAIRSRQVARQVARVGNRDRAIGLSDHRVGYIG
ncbi:hypothetical protein K402DRAFT_452154 [Aulographum hederae CBS 113979]|uniref:Uncharacterized protein n=1 Tax=Aulographum hederae CBS 113979 TaxID=1176131 RepID=A0A6G1H8T3_9PEZI|nr:hypothetical protein K402DRAFT_452154 [Aulographum hederae CBS 113979]